LVVQGASLTDQQQQQARTAAGIGVSLLGDRVVYPGEQLLESKVAGNSLFLLAGPHAGATLTKPNTRIVGAPGARILRLVTAQADCCFEGVIFARGDDNAARLVDLAAAATVLFHNCRFEKSASDAGEFVRLAAGARAHFIGCVFGPAMAAGNVVNNAGVAGNVSIVGCSNKTGQAHVNVTILSETV
jgi:hypothetical protein